MKITQITIYQSPIKLKAPFIISLETLAYANNCIIRIRTDQGIIGFGECSPFMTINGENMDTCYVVGKYLAKVLLGKNPLQVADCIQTMDALIYGNSSIKSAFDMALYDIASQHANLPLYQFLGAENNKTIATDYTISLGTPEKMAMDAANIVAAGFPFIKVKLGENGQKDVECIQQIRAKIGNVIPIRIDANQGWSTAEAIQTLQALAPYHIQHCEEPIPRWNFMELSQVKRESPIPIMADESCCDPHDAQRLVNLEACDAFNIKLGKSGGIYKALQIIRIAEKANMKLQLGGFLESRLGFTAAAHLALTSDAIQFYDFDTPLFFIEDPISEGITYQANGLINLPNLPGLGASVADSYLNKLEKTIINNIN